MSRTHYNTVSKRELTPRQREVLALIVAGKTNRQIGDALGMTLDGAKFHVSEIIAKLGVSTREEAAEWWRAEHGAGARIPSVLRALVTPMALKWAAGTAAVVAVGIVVLAVLGPRSEPDDVPRYEGWVAGSEIDGGLSLRGAGWPQHIDMAVRAQHIVIGTVEGIGESRRGEEFFPVYRIATVRVEETVASRGTPLAEQVRVLVPGGRVDGVDMVMTDVGPDFVTGDRVLLYLEPANFDWLEAGVWMVWLDQRIYTTPVFAAASESLPLDMVIRAIRERRD